MPGGHPLPRSPVRRGDWQDEGAKTTRQGEEEEAMSKYDVYVSGPRDNRDSFTKALNQVATAGDIHLPYECERPLDSPENFTRRNFALIAESSIIVMLPNWRLDLVSRREMQVAIWCGLDLYELINGTMVRLSVERATAIIDKGLEIGML